MDTAPPVSWCRRVETLQCNASPITSLSVCRDCGWQRGTQCEMCVICRHVFGRCFVIYPLFLHEGDLCRELAHPRLIFVVIPNQFSPRHRQGWWRCLWLFSAALLCFSRHVKPFSSTIFSLLSFCLFKDEVGLIPLIPDTQRPVKQCTVGAPHASP